MNKFGFHPFHIVDMSPWPLMSTLASYSVILNFYYMLSTRSYISFLVSFISILMVVYQWWRDVVRESTYQGFHSICVCSGLYLGICMFILSEVMFFFSFFFGYFFTSLNPDPDLGSMWPPVGIQPLDFLGIPILNSIILLSSGVSITWSHHYLMSSDFRNCMLGMIITVLLGVLFSFFQFMEYYDCFFSISDSVYGSLFFIATGFHGLHVIIGTIFIMVGLLRMSLMHVSSLHHIGFEASAWYWHFVDVVWMFLFICIYWWGS